MAENNGRIKRSRILTHPLGGRVALLREVGTIQDFSAVQDAWAKGLGSRQLWPPRKDFKDPDHTVISTFIHDEATQNIITGQRKAVERNRPSTM